MATHLLSQVIPYMRARENQRCWGTRADAMASWRDGATHLVMSPQEFMQRQAALVPRLRLQPICLHGTLAPKARRHSLVLPRAPEAHRDS